MLTRRELLTGAAAVGAFAALPDDVEAMGRRQRRVLLGGVNTSFLPLGPNGELPKAYKNPTLGRYYANGVVYGSEAAFLAATLGSNTGGNKRVYGSYLDPTATNLLLNGNFNTDVANWTQNGTGSSIAWQSDGGGGGVLVHTAAGATNGFQQGLSNFLGRAARLTATGQRGTTTNNVVAFAGNNGFGSGIGSSNITTTNPTVVSIDFTGIQTGATSVYLGGRNTSASGTGTAIWDNFSAIEAWPFQNYPNGNYSLLVSSTAPASSAADEVVWQSDCSSDRDKQRMVRKVADGHLWFESIVFNSTQAALDLGALALGADFTAVVSATQNSFNGSLAGIAATPDVSGICPGATIMREGAGIAGANPWGGGPITWAIY